MSDKLQNYIDSLFQDVPEPKRDLTIKEAATIKRKDYTLDRRIERTRRASR